jgi:ribonuclease HI
MKTEIFTDGSCLQNPGPAGYAVIIKNDGLEYKKFTKSYLRSTNNRMELMAVIDALKHTQIFNKNEVILYSDSKYITDAVNLGWIAKWKNRKLSGIKNPDLWKEFIEQHQTFKNISFVWVKGHNGHSENEECDKLAAEAASTKNGIKNRDIGYL